jgi:protein-disulfide isomerase
MKLLKTLPLLAAAISFAIPSFAQADSSTFTPDQVQQIQGIVHNYLVQNPQVLIEVSNALQKQQMSQLQVKATALIRENADQLLNAPNSIVLGNPNGKVTVVEFYDFQCHHCRDSAPAFDDAIKNNPDVRVIFKDLPIFGQISDDAARASLAAYALDPGKYLAFHDALMQAPIPYDKSTIKKAAEATGYDYSKLHIAMQDKSNAAVLKANFELAEKLLEPTINVVATPAIVVLASDTTASSTAPVEFMPGQIDSKQLQDLINQVSGTH